jgi:hypothetical protein
MARTFNGLSAAMLALSFGCCLADRAAERTVEIHQLQTMSNTGQFEIDVSQLPADAIQSQTTTGGAGAPVTSLTIDSKYRIRVVLVPVKETKTDSSSDKY